MEILKSEKMPDFIGGTVESLPGGREENQDAYGFADTPLGFLMIVCDGMGGGPAGKTASTMAVREIIEGVERAQPEEKPEEAVVKAVKDANKVLYDYARSHQGCVGMGSTCVVLLVTEDYAVAAHVGDSRIYQLRGKTKVFRTFDHSLVFELVKSGALTEEQARTSAQSNVISRALGIKDEVEADVAILPYRAGDRFAMTSDGIHGMVGEPRLIEMLSDKKIPIDHLAVDIAGKINEIGKEAGGTHDNLTILSAETKVNSKKKSGMSKKMKIIVALGAFILILSLILNGLLLYRL